jgi:secreted trypsin-like serine protease
MINVLSLNKTLIHINRDMCVRCCTLFCFQVLAQGTTAERDLKVPRSSSYYDQRTIINYVVLDHKLPRPSLDTQLLFCRRETTNLVPRMQQKCTVLCTLQGDSGGPLNCNYPTASDSRQVVFGVTSWGISGPIRCLQSYPSVYTRVAYYLGWIQANTP